MPSGRKPAAELLRLSSWYNGLDPEGREHVGAVIQWAANYTLFGALCVLDGARAIEDPPERGLLELRYTSGDRIELLSSSDGSGPTLHELL